MLGFLRYIAINAVVTSGGAGLKSSQACCSGCCSCRRSGCCRTNGYSSGKGVCGMLHTTSCRPSPRPVRTGTARRKRRLLMMWFCLYRACSSLGNSRRSEDALINSCEEAYRGVLGPLEAEWKRRQGDLRCEGNDKNMYILAGVVSDELEFLPRYRRCSQTLGIDHSRSVAESIMTVIVGDAEQ